MSTITGVYRVNADGNVVVQVGAERAGADVEVSVRTLVAATKPFDEMTDEEWREAVAATAGSIDDPAFRRPEQPRFEHRLEFE